MKSSNLWNHSQRRKLLRKIIVRTSQTTKEVRMETYKRLFISVVLLSVFGQAAAAQVVKNMSLLGNYGKGEGESKAVFAAGSLVYYGLGNKMQIASFSNPAVPVKIGSVVLPDIVEDLVRTSINSNQYIVASGGGRMWIINVQNPTLPVLTADVDVATGTTCEGIATSGTYAYVAAGGSGLRVYNIATPSAPVFVASIDSLAYCEAIVISGQYAYIAAGSRSFIVDISNPAAPVAVSLMAGFGGYHQSINVRSGYVYICNYSVGISIVNVANPASPVNVKEVPAGDRVAKIVFDGNYAYAAIGDLGMSIFNVTNPASPVFVSTTPTAGRSRSVYYGAVTISGTPTGHIFVANSTSANGVSGINVSNPASPTTAAFLPAATTPSGSAYTPFYANGKVYIAYGTAGLRIVDVSNPAAPTLISTTPLGGDSRSLVVSGNYAYIAGRDSGVFIVDVTNASSPQKVKSIKTPRSRGITVSGKTLFVAVSDSGVAIIDITNPGTASLVKYTGNSVYGENLAINGNIGGITDYSKITFYDMTTPTAPVKKGATGSFKTGNEGFAISGNYAYVPDGDSLKIFNITDLNAPVLVSKIKTGGYGFTASVSGNYCYVASEGTGIRAINISNPSSPVEDGYYDGAPQPRGVVANGKYIYVAEKGDGLAIYSNDLVTSVSNDNNQIPKAFRLHQNYPNPFNPTTNISIELKEKAFVSLDVFNSLGQQVAVLMNNQMSEGSYKVPFNGSSLSTGVYLYRLQANGVTIAKKMILVK